MIRNSRDELLQTGTRVRVHDRVPGWGKTRLDRYGVIERCRTDTLGALAYVRTKTTVGFVRIEDLVVIVRVRHSRR